jgi:chromosome segregation ATPase
MKATLSQAAERWTAAPVRFGSLHWNRGPVLLLLGLLLSVGCKDRDMEKQVSDAKANAAKLELRLAGAIQEISDLKAELKAVRQTRDELQEQSDKTKQERDHAVTLAEQAKEAITTLTATTKGQAGATTGLEKQIADLKALVAEQQKVIDELQKGAAAQPAAAETTGDAAKDKTPPTEPNEKP